MSDDPLDMAHRIGQRKRARSTIDPELRKSLLDTAHLNDQRQQAERATPATNGKPRPAADEHPPALLGDAIGGPVNGTPADPPEQERPVWPPPVELVTIPESERFPISVLPYDLQRFITEGGKAMNCPPDYFAIPMLAIAGGCIGNSRWLYITRTHEQCGALFACVVGTKGTAKSPALKMVREPLDKAQRDRRQNWERQKLACEEAAQGKKGESGPEPTMSRVIVGDVTTESLSMLLGENPRGMTLVRDELAGMLASMNQYKSGGGHDRQWFLELWAQNLSPRDRKSDKGPPVLLDRPFVGIIGGTQPDVVERFRGEPHRGAPPPDDGFLDRWLFSFPAELPAIGERWLEISTEATTAWGDCVQRLLAMQRHADDDGELRPFFLRLDTSGRKAWQMFTDAHAAELNIPDFPDHLRGHWAKLRGYCGRLALIVHLLHTDDDKADVNGEAVNRAAELVKYFKSHARKVYLMMDADHRVKAAKKILAWIARENRSEFKRWELHKDVASDGFFPTLESLDVPLELLETHNYLRQRPEESGGRGRPPSPTYIVNPSWNRRE